MNGLLAILLVLGLASDAPPEAQKASLGADAWRGDLAFLVDQVETFHPDPWRRADRQGFHAAAAELGRRIPDLDDHRIAVELMRLVARLDDGHSKLVPDGEHGFRHWYPVRFHVFSDGVFLTAVASELAALGGAEVQTIAGRPAGEVVAAVAELFGADNRFGGEEFAFLAASAEILDALGIHAMDAPLVLELVLRDGSRATRLVSATAFEEASMEWRFWGEIFAPMGIDSVTGFDGLTTRSVYAVEEDNGMPLHLEARIPYRWKHVPEASLIYLQIRYMTPRHPRAAKSFVATWQDALDRAQADPDRARRLVIDLRFNIGGDGSLVRDFVTRLIRHYPYALEPGHVFVLTSGATFSAGVMLAEELIDHVPVILVGEPMGAPFNAFGDAETVKLPASGFALDVSRRWWQLAASDDVRRFVPVQVPVPFSGAAYFGRRDPALELITNAEVPFPTLDRILLAQGGAAARAAFDEAAGRWGTLDYWSPVDRMTLDDLAKELVKAERLEDARVALELNTELFPGDWDTWDDLGQVCVQMARAECVRQAYTRALELAPTNSNAGEQRARLEELPAPVAGE